LCVDPIILLYVAFANGHVFVTMIAMALTRDFREIVMARVRKDPRFRESMLNEAVNACLEEELDAGKAMLRDLVNATIGFEELARRVSIPSKSLHRMLSSRGNPSSEAFFGIIAELARDAELRVKVETTRRKAPTRRTRRTV
jgi:DNA-binding phage protein